MSARHDEYRVDWRSVHPGRPVADEPHSFWDRWIFLVPFGLMCIGVLLWRAGVFA